jgi:hypothetical protein
VLSVRPVPAPWRSRILRPCQAPRNCTPDQICTTARFSCRKPHQGQPQASLDSQQRMYSKHRMPRVKVPIEDNGPCDFLRGQTREHSTIAVDLLFLHRFGRRPFILSARGGPFSVATPLNQFARLQLRSRTDPTEVRHRDKRTSHPRTAWFRPRE